MLRAGDREPVAHLPLAAELKADLTGIGGRGGQLAVKLVPAWHWIGALRQHRRARRIGQVRPQQDGAAGHSGQGIANNMVVDMVANAGRPHDQGGVEPAHETGKLGFEPGFDIVIVRPAGPEQSGRIVIAPMGRLGERQVDGLGPDQVAGGLILGPAQRHIVDLGAKAFVELASKRKPLRPRDAGREAGRHHDTPAGSGEAGERRACREDGVVQMR